MSSSIILFINNSQSFWNCCIILHQREVSVIVCLNCYDRKYIYKVNDSDGGNQSNVCISLIQLFDRILP